MRASRIGYVAACLLGVAGCSSNEPGLGNDDFEAIEDGKVDNYYSNVAAEYEVSGTIRVAMSVAEYADELVRTRKVQERLSAVGLYLTTYMTDKFRGIDIDNDGTIEDNEIFFRNDGYGGFHAMVRNYSLETVSVTGDPEMGVQASFTLDLAGPKDLMRLLERADATATRGAGDTLAFSFQMPEGVTSNPDNPARREIRNFDPRTYTGALESVALTMRAHAGIGNAFPQYDRFVEDGVFDVTLFFGHDYNMPRSDLREAEETFAKLEELGFDAPVDTFSQLGAESGPFVRTAKANGRSVRFEVRVFHSDMFVGRRSAQHDLALSELVARDVFFYPGHAGPYYGFYLADEPGADVNYHEFATAPLTDKPQLFVAQGCQTYSQYADMLYANPAKDEGNLDVITTVNYSYGQGTLALLENLVRVNSRNQHSPSDFYSMVRDLNIEWYNQRESVFYGVIGMDGNSRLHPYAAVGAIGAPCNTAADCGDPAGNACVRLTVAPSRRCAAIALAPEACPEGRVFRRLVRSGLIEAGACVAH